jgi:DNA-binding beta-propeller fold protein YncE
MVDVGIVPGASPPESPHNIKFTPDGKYWVVVFLNGTSIQVYDASTDQLVKNIPIGNGQWNTIVIANDSQHAYAADYSGGKIAFIDLIAGTSVSEGPFPVTGGSAPTLHGLALNQQNDTLYVTCQDLSKIIKIPVNSITDYQDINLFSFGNAPSAPLKPHEIAFSPDYTNYIVTCQATNEIRVFDTSTDTLVKIVPVGTLPQEIAVSKSKNLAFISNTEDLTFAGVKGSVSVFDFASLTELKKVQVGWQPHGIAVDEKKSLVYVANRNVSGGPAPHHAAACSGKNGYLSVIDLNTLERLPTFKPELSVDPYSVAVRP